MGQRISEWILKVSENGAAAKLTKIDQASSKASLSMDKTKGSTDSLGFSFGGLANKVGLAAAALGGIASVGGILTAGINAEKTAVEFAVLSGSVEKATGLINDINKFANATPFENQDLQTTSKLLLNFGFQLNDIIPTLNLIGDVAGGSKDKLNSLGLVFGQIRSLGKLMGGDLLQLINVGFNPLQVISEKTGESMASLKDKMSKGLITFEMVKNAFKTATGPGGKFNNMMQKVSLTASGKISTALGKLGLVAEDLGKRFIPLINSFLDWGIALIDNRAALNNIIRVVTFAGIAFLSYKSIVIGSMIATKVWTLVVGAANLATILFTGGITALSTAMKLNPIGLIVTAVVGLTIAFIAAFNEFEKFRGGLVGFARASEAFFRGFKKMALDTFGGLGDLIAGIFTFDVARANFGLDQLRRSFKGIGDDIAEGFTKGFDEAKDLQIKLPGFLQDVADGLLGTDEKKGLSALSTGSTDSSSGGKNAGKFGKGINGITGGGKSVRNVTVNIDSLIKQLDIKPANLREGVSEIREMVQRELVRAVAGGEQTLSNGSV